MQAIQIQESVNFQTSVDSVEALIKKHSDFEGMSVAHEERTKTLSEQANRLIHAGHYATTRCVYHFMTCTLSKQSYTYMYTENECLHMYYVCSIVVCICFNFELTL